MTSGRSTSFRMRLYTEEYDKESDGWKKGFIYIPLSLSPLFHRWAMRISILLNLLIMFIEQNLLEALIPTKWVTVIFEKLILSKSTIKIIEFTLTFLVIYTYIQQQLNLILMMFNLSQFSHAGIGVSMAVISLIVAIYYNVIMAYTLFYFFSSMQGTLPWTVCKDVSCKLTVSWIPKVFVLNCTPVRTSYYFSLLGTSPFFFNFIDFLPVIVWDPYGRSLIQETNERDVSKA